MTECEEEARPNPVLLEEKTFILNLHAFMKENGTPIEKIPHMGFKQINLWGIYKAVEKLGGYDSVTARRLWKKVYDELGGSPGSTSAATCTRRHYEKLVLPFERRLKGEEDKPMPPSKPRKPYKRNAEGKVLKAERKRKTIQMDSEMSTRRITEATCQGEAAIHPHLALWTPPQTNPLCSSIYASPVQIPSSGPWTAHLPSAPGEVISPLEKKKRLAQASLQTPPCPQGEDKDRPSVIQRSPTPDRVPPSQNSSDGSPVPLSSSSSSRSVSPYSLSSEDGDDVRPASGAEAIRTGSVSEKNIKERHSVSCIQAPKGQKKDFPQVGSRSGDSKLTHDFTWRPINKESVRYFPVPLSSAPSSVSYDWVPSSTSSFTKVAPKPGQPLRPAPIRLGYKTLQGRLTVQDGSSVCGKKLSSTNPWLFQTEKRDKSRAVVQKRPAAHVHHPPSHPTFLPNRTRLPQSQLMYHHFPVNPAAHSALLPYPYAIPLLHPQTGYALPAMSPFYPHKL
ncbi:AT-rich interactive domain-containing protein 5A isoform X2 [Antennarius striatus]